MFNAAKVVSGSPTLRAIIFRRTCTPKKNNDALHRLLIFFEGGCCRSGRSFRRRRGPGNVPGGVAWSCWCGTRIHVREVGGQWIWRTAAPSGCCHRKAQAEASCLPNTVYLEETGAKAFPSHTHAPAREPFLCPRGEKTLLLTPAGVFKYLKSDASPHALLIPSGSPWPQSRVEITLRNRIFAPFSRGLGYLTVRIYAFGTRAAHFTHEFRDFVRYALLSLPAYI